MHSPTPAEVRAAQGRLTAAQAGAIVGASDRAWAEWRKGGRTMPRGLWLLFRARLGLAIMPPLPDDVIARLQRP